MKSLPLKIRGFPFFVGGLDIVCRVVTVYVDCGGKKKGYCVVNRVVVEERRKG